MNRSKRKKIAEETLEIINQKYLISSCGEKIFLEHQIDTTVSATEIVYEGNTVDYSFREELDEYSITVSNETSIAAIRRLATSEVTVGCLNFASAYSPGGGFLNGSEAQEESIARASTLFASLREAKDYYDINRRSDSIYYTDTVIYSPVVNIIRNDEGEVINPSSYADIITAPAVNVGKIPAEKYSEAAVESVMKRRIHLVLSVAASKGINVLILGAWGCGVFKQNPRNIAKLFKESLSDFPKVFKHVHFAVLDRSQEQETISAFKDAFEK